MVAAIFAASASCAYPLWMARQAAKFRGFHSDEYQSFVAALVEARHRANLSQRELALRLDVDPSIIAKYETRVRRIDVVELLKILEALEVDPAIFIADLSKAIRSPNRSSG